VDRIVAHEDRPKPTPRRRRGASDAQSAVVIDRFFRVRWLGYRAPGDTWKPRGALLADVPDLVREYKPRGAARPVRYSCRLRWSRPIEPRSSSLS
ncbi:TPA: hypothetical protein N0F65_006160, partial [Lagenidium giganteum]